MIDKSGNMLYHINNLNTQNERVSYQMASGKVLDQGSDDAMLHAEVINLEDKLRVTEGLKLQIEKTRALNDTADVNIAETKVSLDSIKIDLMKGLNDGMDRNDKLALATNLRGIRENIIDRVNTEVDGEYLFTGSVTTNKTLVKNDDFKINGQVDFGGDGFLREVAVQPGSYRDRGVTAHDVIFYNSDTSADDGAVTFTSREIVIDDSGHTWKEDMSDPADFKLVKLDYNGEVTDEYLKIDSVVFDPQEINIKRQVTAGEEFTINIKNESGADDTLTYTVLAGDSVADVATNLAAQIDALGYMTATGNSEGTISYTNSEEVSFSLSTTSKEAIIGMPESKYTTETISDARSAGRISNDTRSGLLLETKHNYLDDLNIIINALEGYSTITMNNSPFYGEKDEIIPTNEVQDLVRTGLGQTTQQFDATNIGHGELGGRNNVFEVAYDKISTQETHYNILIQETNGADIAKLAMESKSLEMTYQALYSTIAKMNQLSLINFLK